ncbi:MAG: hexose kinase [Nitriliruptorales bacterium]|nr:hexose kinase [Nitriliruptorales bacterium]
MTMIVTLTLNPALDISAHVNRVVPDSKLRLGEPVCEAGGGGLNVSRVLARLGGDSLAIYTRGGPAGARLDALLEEGGVAREAVDIQDDTRENLSIIEDSTGQQFRFVMPGPRLTRDEWQRCLDAVANLDPVPDYVVASGSLPSGLSVDVYADLARMVHEQGGRLVVDTSGEALRAALDEGVYLVKPNVRELARLVGRDPEGGWDPEKEARGLVSGGGSEVVVLSLGAGGAFVTGRDLEVGEHVRSPTVPITSKVGAGDSMVGGLMAALARHEPLLHAVRYGVAAGAAAVMTPGSELCRKEDTDRLFARMREDAADPAAQSGGQAAMA